MRELTKQTATKKKAKPKGKGRGPEQGKGQAQGLHVQAVQEQVAVVRDVLPWREPPLGTVDEFQKQYPAYDHCIVTIYQIVRDLHIKQEVVDIKVIDGTAWGQERYFLECRERSSGRLRLLVPFYLDSEIDLPWLTSMAQHCDGRDEELYVCIHTPESIIYEMISTALP
jgi:hypothetical protein